MVVESEPSIIHLGDTDFACLVRELLEGAMAAASCWVPGFTSFDECMARIPERSWTDLRASCRVERPFDVTLIEPRPLNPFAAPIDPKEQERELEERLEEIRKAVDDPEASGQVVEIAPPKVEVRPDEARHLAEYDSKVEKETRGPTGKTVGTKDPEPAPVPPRSDARPQPPSRASPQPDSHGAGSLAMRGRRGTGTGESLDKRIPGGSPEGLDATEEGIGVQRGEGGAPRNDGPAEPAGSGDGQPMPNRDDLRPSREAIARALGAGSSDYLPDVDEGDETGLNAKSWRHAPFFNRVKRAVAQNWNPGLAYRLRDPTGQIYGRKSRTTILKVSLRPDGSLRDVVIETPCGVDFLDDEAVSAFREAQPFPNPPGGLINPASQLITFKFGFHFEIESGSSWKIFRYSN